MAKGKSKSSKGVQSLNVGKSSNPDKSKVDKLMREQHANEALRGKKGF